MNATAWGSCWLKQGAIQPAHPAPYTTTKSKGEEMGQKDLRRGQPSRKPGTPQLDGHRRLIAAVYLQAFQDVNFLAESQELLEKFDSYKGQRYVRGGSFSKEFLEYMGVSQNKLRKLRQKRKENPREFFENPDHPFHKYLNGSGLGLSVLPEELPDFVDVEILKGQANSLEAKL